MNDRRATVKKTPLALWRLMAVGIGLGILLSAWPAGPLRRFKVMAWNVENLFDTVHAAGREDVEFLPHSSRQWSSVRYRAKLSALSRAIAAAGGASPADIVGLCEVEGDTVLRDLTGRTMLARLHYDYVVTHGADVRGMEVALLYQPEVFSPVGAASLRVPYDSVRERPTRDVLHVAGRLPSGDTLDVFVCHLPSRRGGAAFTAAYRLRTARFIKAAADSVRRVRTRPSVIVMGDFNDEPSDASVRLFRDKGEAGTYDVLTARAKFPKDVGGTYKYQGRWNLLDQMIISTSLYGRAEGLRATTDGCSVFAPPFLLERDAADDGVRPRRTYSGSFYRGGVSDHLPLLLDLWW